MDCRETQTLLTAFHDGELPATDRARVEDHLRGCPECVALLADMARVDRAAGVPDPGPAYWDRFNARVMERVERETDGPRVTLLRPNGGWMRHFRYLVPAAAAAALVLMVARYGGMTPGTPTPTAPPAVSERTSPDSAGEQIAKAAPESRAMKKAENTAETRRLPPPVLDNERFAAVSREERDRLAARSLPEGNVEASRDRATAPATTGVPSPPPMTFQGAPDGQGSPGSGAGRDTRGSVETAGGTPPVAEKQVAGKAKSASGMRIAKEPSTGSPCELARTLAERERIREAEGAQRACLAGNLDAPSREKGLVFLAELLDRQARFADADAVIADVDRLYPQSRPLDLYRQQRPMVQKRQK